MSHYMYTSSAAFGYDCTSLLAGVICVMNLHPSVMVPHWLSFGGVEQPMLRATYNIITTLSAMAISSHTRKLINVVTII